MKKNLTILSAILFTLFYLNASAQDDNPTAKSYLALTGGFSLPLGDYAASTYSNNSAGFAKKGATLGLDAGVYLHKNLGFGVNFSYQDQGELTTADAENLANGYNTSFTKNQTSVSSINRFNFLTLMAGPQYSFLYKNFTLDLRADAGVIKSLSTPYLTIVSSNSAQTFYQLSSGAVSFAYGGSLGLRYSLGDSWDVGVKFNYVESSGIKISNTSTLPGNSPRFQTNMPVSVAQAMLGIAVKF